MSDRDVIAALQRQAAEAEVERLRLVGELEALQERAEKAVAVERSKRDGLLAALKGVLASGLNGGNNVRLALMAASRSVLTDDALAQAEASESAVVAARAAIAAAEQT